MKDIAGDCVCHLWSGSNTLYYNYAVVVICFPSYWRGQSLSLAVLGHHAPAPSACSSVGVNSGINAIIRLLRQRKQTTSMTRLGSRRRSCERETALWCVDTLQRSHRSLTLPEMIGRVRTTPYGFVDVAGPQAAAGGRPGRVTPSRYTAHWSCNCLRSPYDDN